MGYTPPYKESKSNPTKQKLQSGTISKVVSHHNTDETLTKDDLNLLWKIHNETIKELEGPQTERYTRYTSDLIKRLREVSIKLIINGAIAGFESKQDSASYVWQQLKARNIPYDKSNFYKFFKEDEKRPYQSAAFLEKTPEKSHKHDFSIIVGNFENIGEIRKCAAQGDVLCQAKMIDGQVYETTPDKDSDAELTKKPPKDPVFYEQENEYVLMTVQNVIDSLKSVQQYWLRHKGFSELTKEHQRELRETLHMVEKSTEFVNAAYNDKTKVPTFTEHLLVLAYADATQNAAGGLYLSMLRKFGAEKVEFAKEILSDYLVPKQTTKKMAGKTPQLNKRYDPKNKKEAEDRGFYGTKCTNLKCNSFGFRIDYDRIKVGTKISERTGEEVPVYDNKLICYACDKIQMPKTFMLPKMTPKVTMDFDSLNT